MSHTVRVALSPEDHGVVARQPTGSPTEIVRDVPSAVLESYRQAVAALADARAAVVAAAGYSPDTAWDTLMDEQGELLERWLEASDPSGVEPVETDGSAATPSSPADRPLGLLRRAVELMEVNARSAEQAGLAGDARRWRIVRKDVARCLDLLTE